MKLVVYDHDTGVSEDVVTNFGGRLATPVYVPLDGSSPRYHTQTQAIHPIHSTLYRFLDDAVPITWSAVASRDPHP